MDAVLAYDGTFYYRRTLNFRRRATQRRCARTAFAVRAARPGGAALLLGFNAEAAISRLALSYSPLASGRRPTAAPCHPCPAAAALRPSTRRRRSSGNTGPAPPGNRSRCCRTRRSPSPSLASCRSAAAAGRNVVSATMPGKADAKRAWLRARLAATFYERRRCCRSSGRTRSPRSPRRPCRTKSSAAATARRTRPSPCPARRCSTARSNSRSTRAAARSPGPRSTIFRQRPERHWSTCSTRPPALITLGDGIQGHIPVANLSNPSGSIVAVQLPVRRRRASNVRRRHARSR